MKNFVLSTLALMLTMLLVSCGGSIPPMQRDYADAVTNINQVDPYYRAYFRSQNGSNYTLADQRAAYLAAMQTARTPVRASDYAARAPETRLASRNTRKSVGKRSAVASRKATKGKKVTVTRRAIAKKGSKARSGSKAKSKKATASRRTARRSSRRRG